MATGQPMSSRESKEIFNVLQSLGYIFPEIGYCQGMNYIASVLHSYLKDEELTFTIFLSLIVQKNLKGLFANMVPEYHFRHFILD